MATKRKSNTYPVIAYPEGVKVGKVVSGKFGGTKPRHVAYDAKGYRLGTFDKLSEASKVVMDHYREGSK